MLPRKPVRMRTEACKSPGYERIVHWRQRCSLRKIAEITGEDGMSDTLRGARASRPWRWLLLGGIVLGSVDAVFAIAFWYPKGVTATQIFQSIASGLLGKASYEGGEATAWLGAGLHYFIATMMVIVYYLVARWWRMLVHHPIAYGLPYGVVLYLVMNFVVLPLSAAGMPKFNDLPWVSSSIVMHAIFGVICAMTARKALRG